MIYPARVFCLRVASAMVGVVVGIFGFQGLAPADEEYLALPGVARLGYGKPTLVATPPVEREAGAGAGEEGLLVVGDSGVGDGGEAEGNFAEGGGAETDEAEIGGGERAVTEDAFLEVRWELRALPPRAVDGGDPVRKIVLVPESAATVEQRGEEAWAEDLSWGAADGEGVAIGVEDLGVGLTAENSLALSWFIGRPASAVNLERIAVTVKNALDGGSVAFREVLVSPQSGREGVVQVMVVEPRQDLDRIAGSAAEVPLFVEVGR